MIEYIMIDELSYWHLPPTIGLQSLAAEPTHPTLPELVAEGREYLLRINRRPGKTTYGDWLRKSFGSRKQKMATTKEIAVERGLPSYYTYPSNIGMYYQGFHYYHRPTVSFEVKEIQRSLPTPKQKAKKQKRRLAQKRARKGK